MARMDLGLRPAARAVSSNGRYSIDLTIADHFVVFCWPAAVAGALGDEAAVLLGVVTLSLLDDTK